MVESRTVGDYLALKICGENYKNQTFNFWMGGEKLSFSKEEDFQNQTNFQEEALWTLKDTNFSSV